MKFGNMLAPLLSAFIMSCSSVQEIDTRTVYFNMDSVMSIDMSNCEIVELETDSNSMLYDICDLGHFERKYYVRSRSMLHVYDEMGKYLYDIGTVGKSNREYNSISNVYMNDSCVSIYDFSSKNLYHYSLKGKWLRTESMADYAKINGKTPNHLYYQDGFGYISFNCFGGDDVEVPYFSILDDNKKEISCSENVNVIDGLSFPDDYFVGEDGNLYFWKPMTDSLYVMENHELSYCYHFDFGKYSMPLDVVKKDVFERIDYLNDRFEKKIPIIGMLRFYNMYKGNIYFVCMGPKNEFVLCRFNPNTKPIETKVFSFSFMDQNLKVNPFLKIMEGKIYLSVSDEKNMVKNPSVVILDISDLPE